MWLSLLIVLLACCVGIKADAIDMWVNHSQNKKITGFYTSLEVPDGYDPVTTYWCVSAWWLGYFGIQKPNPSSFTLIMAEWNDKHKSPQIDRSLNRASISQCEENCPEGAVAHVIVLGDNWKTGVKYDFKVEVDFNGTNEIFSSYFFKNDHWELVGEITAPKYGAQGFGYIYQFLENWETNDNQERRGIYSNQHFRFEGDDSWYPATSISPFNNANVVHPHYYADAVPLEKKNGVLLKLDGTGPPDKNGWMYYPLLHVNASNMVPPQASVPPMHGKHTATVVESYVVYERYTMSPITTTTTEKHWKTDSIAPTVTRFETLYDTTVQTEIVHNTITKVKTSFLPAETMSEITHTDTVTEETTITEKLGHRTVTNTTVSHLFTDTQDVTVIQTVQPTITTSAVTSTKYM
ncbi:hypothetical protein K7432_013778 [Basidiobolus ranarum]|uniref:Uncharacterized protein n=1 Tax=Basidiobolus ranarum TaxID=34480 RepID=A0ABR2VRD2_9FUNG